MAAAKTAKPSLTADELISQWIKRFIWLIVFPAALFLSGWSLYWLMRQWGAPWFVAVFASACTDGVAIYAAEQCLSAIREGARGTWERMIVIAFALAGAWINRYHAIALDEPLPAQLGWAIPTLAAAVVYDLKHRSVRREERKKVYKKTGVAYPDATTWFLFPLETWRWVLDMTWIRIPGTMRRKERKNTAKEPVIALNRALIELTPEPDDLIDQPPNQANTQASNPANTQPSNPAQPSNRRQPNRQTSNIIRLNGRPEPSVVRAWCKENGFPDISERGRLQPQHWAAWDAANKKASGE